LFTDRKPNKQSTGDMFKYRHNPDGCMVYNAHNTVFGWKRSAMGALAVYFRAFDAA